MFELEQPWWTFLVRALIVYAALMTLLRLGGKRTVGEFTAFDLVVVILLGEAAQGALTGGDDSVPGGLIAATTLVALNFAVGFASARSALIDKIVEGEPVVLARRGVLNHAAMKRNNIPASDVHEAVRRAGLNGTDEIDLAMLETDGEITIVPKATKQSD